MAILASVYCLEGIIETEQNQTATDSNLASAFASLGTTVVNACNTSTQQMTGVINSAADQSSSSDTNNNLTDATQVYSTWQTMFQGMQKFVTSFSTLMTNQISADTNNEKSTVNLNSYLQAALSTLSSLLSQNY